MSGTRNHRIRVLIIDDSALMRRLLTELLGQDPEVEVVGAAADPLAAVELIKSRSPDVLTLDVEMPRMDGLTFLARLMSVRPMPVVMISSLTEKGCETAIRAMELGAIDIVTKPKLDLESGTLEMAREIVMKVKGAARAHVLPPGRRPIPATAATRGAAAAAPGAAAARMLNASSHRLIAIGASTGGTEAIRTVLTALPPDSPGIVIVQHMPPNFSRAFAERLNTLCAVTVAEARDGDRILAGRALIAPGGYHMEVSRDGANPVVRIVDGPPVNYHRPSVDVLFDSCARHYGASAVGVLLTGMGNDGARGLLHLREAGAHTVAEHESTCVVYGMPMEAIKLGAAAEILPLDRVAVSVCERLAA